MGGREHDDASGHTLGLREQHGYDLRCRLRMKFREMIGTSIGTIAKVKVTTDEDQPQDGGGGEGDTNVWGEGSTTTRVGTY